MPESVEPRAPERLRCEYIANPLGLETARPRLSWWPVDSRPAEIQTAYEIVAAQDLAALEDVRHPRCLWHSGRVDSSRSVNVPYGGPPLGSAERVYWRVRTYDSDGLPSPWSEANWFESGLLEAADWRGDWIEAPLTGSASAAAPVPALRRTFHLDDASLDALAAEERGDEQPAAAPAQRLTEVRRARLYVAALGLQRTFINGVRVSSDELEPGWTDYRRRLYYQSYDVKHLLRPGLNAVGVLLGDGWYCGELPFRGRQGYGARPALLAQLRIDLVDGRTLYVTTDQGWRWQTSGLLASDLSRGEDIDARQQPSRWTRPDFDDDDWARAQIRQLHPPTLVGRVGPVQRVLRELNPVASFQEQVPNARRARLIYDFGRNTVGRSRVVARLKAGTLLTVTYAERREALAHADATREHYTARGDADGEVIEGVFSLHGFRFVAISGRFEADAIDDVKALVIGADVEPTGRFDCDEPRLNRLQSAIEWSQRGALASVPWAVTRQAQRLPLTNVAQGFARTASFNANTAAFAGKWLLDLADAQSPSGDLPAVVPVPPGCAELECDGGAGSADAYLSYAWNQYRCYDDKRVLERHFEPLQRYVRSLERRFPDGVRGGVGNAVLGPVPVGLDADVIATAYYYRSVVLLTRIAGVLGQAHAIERFERLAAHVRTAFRHRFVTPGGELAAAGQTALVLTLHFGLLDGPLDGAARRRSFERLVDTVEAQAGSAAAFDELSAPYLLHVLTAGGRLALAYRTLLSSAPDSWLERVAADATTLPATFQADSDHSGALDNSCALAGIGDWLYRTVAGIDLVPTEQSADNAYRRVRIEPQPPLGPEFPGAAPLGSISVQFDSVHGRYSSAWQVTPSAFVLEVGVPVNGGAQVILPNGGRFEVSAGVHSYEVPLTGGEVNIPILERRVQ
ncbi:MAG: family 78 glycoside hydrolase catalytic domain [Pseudomonadota bacterium]